MTKVLHDSENVACCMVVSGTLVFMKQLIGITERPNHATFSLAKSMTFPIFGNADTQSANHKNIHFYPYLRTTCMQLMLFTTPKFLQ